MDQTQVTFEELQVKVLEWAKEKGILDKATPLAQAYKTKEECEELRVAIHWQATDHITMLDKKGNKVFVSDEIKDALGDIMVTILIGAKLQGLDLKDCLESAYNVISKRTGKMINGQFVKD